MAIRDNFPPPGSDYMGGTSDGWEYKTIFRGTTLSNSYDMIRTFLQEEGYDNVPLPANAQQLLLFKIPTRNRQIILFEDNGYVHNPIKILFPNQHVKNALLLCVYNEQETEHLLRFHGVHNNI